AAHLVPVCKENDVAIVFGREDRGLLNEDLKLCHALLTIPTSELRALNLAQSVVIVCYELFRTSLAENVPHAPRLANRFELEAMYEKLGEMLERIGFLNAENPDHWMGNLRRFFSRLPLTARDVKIIRGICRQMDWFTRVRLGQMAEEKKTDGAG
ncbi:MAG: TrmH family RNA methyltransferase, partial [Thermodesulfobacteriota bacterium]